LLKRISVTLKIDTTPGLRSTTVKLIGRIETGHLGELRALLDAVGGNMVLDLSEVPLVNLDVVRFLITCETQGIQLLNCSAFMRKWIDRERQDS
jgi:anti-anti-sigma regulatory factor